jgi:hypothetical protein
MGHPFEALRQIAQAELNMDQQDFSFLILLGETKRYRCRVIENAIKVAVALETDGLGNSPK